jgi:hypothetical protein
MSHVVDFIALHADISYAESLEQICLSMGGAS